MCLKFLKLFLLNLKNILNSCDYKNSIIEEQYKDKTKC